MQIDHILLIVELILCPMQALRFDEADLSGRARMHATAAAMPKSVALVYGLK